jgi:hypothetical protein
MNLPSPAVLGQVAGLAAVVAGLFLVLGIGWALLSGGALLTLWCVVAESLNAPVSPPAARSGANGSGGV